MYENKIKNKKEQKDKISAIIILEQYLMYAKK
jgi:RNase H-fold protein (predicted Holliday junction resolvase)